MKLLEYLLQNGLAADERSAKGLIMAGKVLVDDKAVTSASHGLKEGQAVRLKAGVSTDVSRGALKLRPVLAEISAKNPAFDPHERICIDLGASTGGFSQVLLECNPQRLYAIDVAYGILADQIRNDPRVVVLERTNARTIDPDLLDERASLMVGDLSFISWTAVLPAVLPLLSAEAALLLLVKPQFELSAGGRGEELEKGVLRDMNVLHECLTGLYNLWSMHGLGVAEVIPAGTRGAQGNQEFFVAMQRNVAGLTPEVYASSVDAAIRRSSL